MTPPPAVSVIVPTYNRPERLAACLDALARLEAPEGGFEVVVVDDGSPVPAVTVAEPFRDRLAVEVLRQENAGPAAARNRGAARARGPLLAFTDDDCQPAPGWLRAFTEAARGRPGHLLIGRTENTLRSNPFAEASQLLLDYLYEYYGPESGRSLLVASNNMALPAEAFEALGGFDERFGRAAAEDRDFSARWHEAGRPASRVPEAAVHHRHEMGPREFWRQHATYGRGAARYHRLRALRGAADVTPEPLRFYLDLVAYPLRTSRRPAAWAHAALLGVAQVANVAGFVLAQRDER